MARDIVMDALVREDSRGLRTLANELDNTAASTDRLSQQFHETQRNSAALDRQLASMKNTLGELGAEFIRTGDKTLLGDMNRQRTSIRNLERIKQEMAAIAALEMTGGRSSTGGGGFGGMLAGLAALPAQLKGSGLVIAGTIGALLAPALGAVVAGAVVGGVGAGGILGGILAAKGDSRVQAEWEAFVNESLSPQDFGRDAFVGPAINAIRSLRDAANDLDIGADLAKAAPALGTLVDGLISFAENAWPGVERILEQSGPIMAVLADGFSDTGAAVGDMLTDIVESKGTLEGLRYGFQIVADVIRLTGNTVRWLGDRFEEWNNLNVTISGTLEDVYAWVSRIGSFGMLDSNPLAHWFGIMNDKFERTQQAGSMVPSVMDDIMGAVRRQTGPVRTLAAAWTELFEAQMLGDRHAISFEQALDDLTDTVKEHGRNLDITSQAGRDVTSAFLDAIDVARRHRESMSTNADTAAAANIQYQQQIDKLYKLGAALGFTKQQLDAIIGSYAINLNVTTNYKITGSPGSQVAQFPGGKVFEGLEMRAGGGDVWAGNLYQVNELATGRRVELFEPAVNGRVIPLGGDQGGAGGVATATRGGDLLALERAVERAMARVAIMLDGQRVGAAQAREANRYVRGG